MEFRDDRLNLENEEKKKQKEIENPSKEKTITNTNTLRDGKIKVNTFARSTPLDGPNVHNILGIVRDDTPIKIDTTFKNDKWSKIQVKVSDLKYYGKITEKTESGMIYAYCKRSLVILK